MKTKEQVIEWLKSKEWYEQFKNNVEKYGQFKKIEKYLEIFSNYDLIFCAFQWNCVPEGANFWVKKCVEFMNWWNNEND